MIGGGNISAWVWSLLVHALIAAGFLVSFRIFVPAQTPQPSGEVIQAVAVDAEAMRAREQAKIEEARRAEEARQAELRRQREAAEAQRRREEEARQAELRRQEEQRRKAAEAEARRKAEAEEARRKAAEEEARRKAEVEHKRQEEEARRRAEEEARRKAEAERKRREAEEAARKQREAELRQQLEAEEQRFAAIQSGKQAQWVDQIRNKIMRNWSEPPGLPENFYCRVLLRQIPGGEVVEVKVEKCDNEVLARSAEAAVWKASPLPKPDEASLFESYIPVTFAPEEKQ